MKLRQASLTFVMASILGSQGCSTRTTRVQASPPAPPPTQQSSVELIEPPPAADAAPARVPADSAPEVIEPAPTLPPRPKPHGRQRAVRTAPARKSARPAPVARAAAEAPAPGVEARATEPKAAESLPPAAAPKPEEPATGLLQLQEALPADERDALTRSYQQADSESRQFLVKLGDRSLTQSQSESVARIKGFLKEAQDLQGSDIRTASQLAGRALLLTRELSKSLP